MGELSCRRGALEFEAEVLKVFLADLQLQHFFNHGREVCQRADRSQRHGVDGPYEPPCRSQNEGVLDRFQGHAAFVQLGREHSIRAAHNTRSAWRRTIGCQEPPDILVLRHEFSPAGRAATDR